MSVVKIPTSHFILSAKRQYADVDTAIVREATQNSVDAGSTEIKIETGPTWCKITDNGCGMSEQVLTDAMLTLSGSYKSSSSIGGFGMAKELLILSMEKYEIHTLDNLVHGSVLEYDLTKTNFFQGTAITMHFHSSYNYDEDNFVRKAKDWLAKCDTTANITINGSTVPRHIVRTEVKDLGWGKVYCEDSKETVCHMNVRIKGVCMFSPYIGDVKKNIVLEVTNPSIEILTSNRDGLQWSYGEILQKLCTEITTDKQSFGRLHNTITRYTGNTRSFINKVIRSLKEMGDRISTPTGLAVKAAIAEIEKEMEAGNIEPQEAIVKLRTMSKTVDDGWIIDKKLDDYINDVDFHIQINDKGYEKIPDEIAPSTKMKLKYRKLACLWKAALKHVFESNYMEASYCIGWIVDQNSEAAYSSKDGLEMFLLNPYLASRKDFKNKKEMVYSILVTAAHEVAHRRQKYHDESFVQVSEKLLLKAISELSSYRSLLSKAAKETI
jgi:hypothetical protein